MSGDAKARDAVAEATGTERDDVVGYQSGRHRPKVWQNGGGEVYVVGKRPPPKGHAGYLWSEFAKRVDGASVWVSAGPVPDSDDTEAGPAPAAAARPVRDWMIVTTAATLGKARATVKRYHAARRPGARGVTDGELRDGYWKVAHDDGTVAAYTAAELAPVPYPPALDAALAVLRDLGADHPDPQVLVRVHCRAPAPGYRFVRSWLHGEHSAGLLDYKPVEDGGDGHVMHAPDVVVDARIGEELENTASVIIELIEGHVAATAVVLAGAGAARADAVKALRRLQLAGFSKEPVA